jgi:hypothetical protein
VKRVLAFLLLLAAGLALLYVAIEGEDPVNTQPVATDGEQPPDRPATGLPLQQGNLGASVSQTGPIEFPQYRTVPQPDGSARHERVFVLKAEDSKPVSETLQQLDRVQVLFFDGDQPSSRVSARQAFVELSRDASGRPSLREHKEIDLREAVFESLPGARMQGVRLEVGDAKVDVAEAEIRLRTVDDQQPVLLVVGGQRSGTLRGKGMQARLPRDRQSSMRRADVEILHEPVLETAGITVSARGRMHYSEDLATGAARITVDDHVLVDFDRAGFAAGGGGARPADGDRGKAHVAGDQFVGWLQRSQRQSEDGREREDVSWQRLLLTGAPARVVLPEGHVDTPRISVLPGPFGEPFLVTAHGGESRIVQTGQRPGSRQTDPVTGTSPRRIHVVRPGSSAGAFHRSFGFPQWTVRALDEVQIAVFEGKSRLDSGVRTVEASEGLHLFRRDGSETGIARGFGEVRIEQRAAAAGESAFVAAGNDGFRLVVTAATQDLQLGPPLPETLEDGPWCRHRYDVLYGPATVRGLGACRVQRAGERTQLWLRAPGAEISGRLTATGLELENVRQLEATIDGADVLALEAAGLPARALRAGASESVRAAAPRLSQIGPRSLALLGPRTDAPANLWAGLAGDARLPALTRTLRGPSGSTAGEVTVHGPRIDVHHLGGGDVLVDAVAADGLRPRVDGTLVNADGRTTTATFHAARLQALPFALTPEMRLAHGGWGSGAIADIVFASAGQPWLLVDDVQDFRLVDPLHGLVEGNATRLVLSQGAEAGLFVGDPDRLVPAEVRRTHEGRELTTRGARVRVFREQELRLQALRTFEDRPTFLLPSMTLHDAGSDGLLAHMHAVCQGNIDVLPDVVVFGGPVVAQGLRPDGSEDPEGIHLDAGSLRMFRQAETGEVIRVLGQDVRVDWSRLDATSSEVELDLRRTRCIARDVEGAMVAVPGRGTFTAPRVEVNYETMAVTCFHGRLVQSDTLRAGEQ